MNSPAKWVPRWMSGASTPSYQTYSATGNVEPSSTFVGWYRALIETHSRELHDLAPPISLNTFTPTTSLPRKGLSITAPLNNFNLQVTLEQENSDHAVEDLIITRDEASFLYPTFKPIAIIKEHSVSLRNCALVEYLVEIGSGLSLDLTTLSKFSERVVDSPIYAADYFGDIYYYDPDQVVSASNIILLPTMGPYAIRFEHQPLFQRVLSGGLITVNGRSPKPEIEFYSNSIDRYAAILGLERKADEDNLSLRARCQNLSLSRTQAQCISASLGRSTIFRWDTGHDYTVSASGSAEINIPIIPKYTKVVETPNVNSGKLTLSNFPIGAVTLRLNDQIVDPETYSTSGNMITINSGILKTLIDSGSISERVQLEYRTQQLTTISTTSSGGSLFLDVPKVQGQQLVLGTIPSDVVVEELVQTDIEFRWDRGYRSNAGLGTFGGYYSENNTLHYK